jgi:hypothetical protein
MGGKTEQRRKWGRALIERRGKNQAAVALANQNARLAWVLLGSEQTYAAEARMGLRGRVVAILRGPSYGCEAHRSREAATGQTSFLKP